MNKIYYKMLAFCNIFCQEQGLSERDIFPTLRKKLNLSFHFFKNIQHNLFVLLSLLLLLLLLLFLYRCFIFFYYCYYYYDRSPDLLISFFSFLRDYFLHLLNFFFYFSFPSFAFFFYKNYVFLFALVVFLLIFLSILF